MALHDTKVAFIGAGNMATALIKGLISNGVPGSNIWAADAMAEQVSKLKAETGINAAADNSEAIKQADVVVLAVKPQVMANVLKPLQETLLNQNCVLISIAAGITLESMEHWVDAKVAIVRCMPNTPALVQAGASALYANSATSAKQKQLAESILSAVGSVTWLSQETDMNAVTALSGSGPAYFFLLMEAMQEAAESIGLDSESAQKLCIQTAFGAAKLALNSDVEIAELRRRVTSPGGTTEAALQQFETDNFKHVVERALKKAADRSEDLAVQLGKAE
jgi:pyrroline-5-carboxylate reductase